jgi:anti-anti-sigma regulatory factor
MQTTPYSVWWVPRGVAVVAMPAQIDFNNCGQVHAALMQEVQAGATVVIADLTGTRCCGYSATVTLVSVQARAARAGARLRVAAAGSSARRIGQIAGAGHRLDFYPDLQAALAGPRMRGPAGGEPAAGHTPRLLGGGAAPNGQGQPAGRLLAVSPASQDPPPGPFPAPAWCGH